MTGLPDEDTPGGDKFWTEIHNHNRLGKEVNDRIAAYAEAVEHLDRTGDAKPLAKLLRDGWEMPSQSMRRLADMLDPAPGHAGRRLKATEPSQAAINAEARAHREMLLHRMISDHVAAGVGIDAAIMLVVEKTGRGRSTLYGIWRSKR